MTTIPMIFYDLVDTIYGTIYLYGSWDNWTKGIEVEVLRFRNISVVYAVAHLSPGNYQYKFLDKDPGMTSDKWFHNRDKHYTVTPEGYINNVIDVNHHELRTGFSPQCERCIEKAEIINHGKGDARLCLKCLMESYNERSEYDVIGKIVTIV